MRRMVWMALLGYVGVVALMFFGQRTLMYLPTHSQLSAQQAGLKGVATENLTTQDGQTIRAFVAGPQKHKPVVIFFHGNAGDLSHRVPFLALLQTNGYGFVAIDYRGFGASTGKPTQAGLVADAAATLDFARKAFPTTSLVVWGESLGTGVVLQALAEQGTKAVRAVVLQSPFDSITHVAKFHYPWLPVSLLLKDRFDSANVVERVKTPLLFLHGDEDNVVPLRFGQALYAKANEPKVFKVLQGFNHNNLPMSDMVAHMQEFLEAHPAKISNNK